MERTYIRDSRIIKLEKDIKNGESNALENFYKYIETNGAPLIEKIQGEDEFYLVTIIYKEEKRLDNVVLIPPVGMRKLEDHVMDRLLDTDLFYISYKVEKDIMFSYHFFINDTFDKDWEKRWRNAENDKFNKYLFDLSGKISNKYKKVSYVRMPYVKEDKYIYPMQDGKKGLIRKLKYHSVMIDKDYNIDIYLPYNYDEDKTYGMIMLNDGYEYLHILHASTVLDNLITLKLIEPVIGVFIEADKERGTNLKCNDTYTKFLGEELTNYIKSMYNISNDPSKNTISGYSLGGLEASYAALCYPRVFGNVISQSGSYWYNKDDTVSDDLWINRFAESKPKENINFYINVGKIEPKRTMIDSNIKFKDKLLSLGYDVHFEFFNSGHDYLCWGETLAEGLINLFNRKR